MKTKTRQSGLSLMEQAVVIAAVAILVAFGLPAVRAIFKSVEAEGGGRAMISAALASARAIAAKEQHYAGVRFQHSYNKDDPNNSPLKAPQYMIFIVQDPQLGTYGFRAVEGLKPIKLPDSVGVMEVINTDGEINDEGELIDKTTFSIIFSPSGKLVIHDVHTINRDGHPLYSPFFIDNSKDDIFNTETMLTHPTEPYGMFIQDYGPTSIEHPHQESSKNSFRIYDRETFGKIDEGSRCSDYLEDLDIIYINPYTGTMINR